MRFSIVVAGLALNLVLIQVSSQADQVLEPEAIRLAQYIGPRTKHRESSDTTQITTGGEIKTEHVVKLSRNPNAHIQRCEADASLFFTQMDNQVRVKTLIKSADCDAASGGYTVFMRTSEQDGEIKMTQYSESWQSLAGIDQEVEKFYPMHGAVELKSLYLKRLSCTCDQINSDDD